MALYHELVELGEVWVVAPTSVQSAASHGITLSAPLLTSVVKIPDAFSGIAVDGRPADCVKLAVSQILPRRPDLVISGMNSGANVGINVIYSGTVAAAIEAAFPGIAEHRSFAASPRRRDDGLSAGRGAGEEDHRSDFEIPPVCRARCQRKHSALKPGESPAGVKIVRQCTRPWVDTYERRRDPRGRDYFWNTSVFTLGPTDDDTDVAALRQGYITITPLQFDLTDHRQLKHLQQ